MNYEGLEQSDVLLVKKVIANQISDLALKAAEAQGSHTEYIYGSIAGLIEAHNLILKAQAGEL